MKSSKYFLIVAGFLAFTLTFLVSFLSDYDVSNVLLKASIGCIVGVFLMKHLLKVLIHNLYQSRIAQAEKEVPVETLEAAKKEEQPPAEQKSKKEEPIPTQSSTETS